MAAGRVVVGKPYLADELGIRSEASSAPSPRGPSSRCSSEPRRTACSKERPACLRQCSYHTLSQKADSEVDQTHHSIATNVAFDVEVLTQRCALQCHGDPVQEHGAGETEQPAIGVARVNLLGVVGWVDVETLRGTTVQARCAAP